MRTRCLTLAAVLCLTTTAAAQSKLPDGAVAQIGVHRLRASSAILDSAFTPDGKTLVVAFETKDNQPNVILFDVATGLERKRLNIAGVRHIAMAQHKPRLLVDTNTGFEVWDLAKEKREQQWPLPKGIKYASAIAISPDGSQTVAAAWQLFRWNADTGEALEPIRRRKSEFPIETLQFSNDGSKIMGAESGGRRERYGLDPVTLELGHLYYSFLANLLGPNATLLNHAAWTIGGNWYLNEITPRATVWDARTGCKLLDFRTQSSTLAFSPDGTTAACDVGGQRIDIFRLGHPWTHVGTVDGYYRSFEFTPDGKKLLLTTDYSFVAAWDLAGRKVAWQTAQFRSISTARMSQNGKLLAVIGADESEERKFDDEKPSGRAYAKQPHNHVQIIDLTTGEPMRYATGFFAAIGGVAYSPDGRELATYCDNTILIHDPKTGRELRRWIAHKPPIFQLTYSPDGKMLASVAVDDVIQPSEKKARIRLWDPTTGKERERYRLPDVNVRCFAFTRDGKALTIIDKRGAAWRADLNSAKMTTLGEFLIENGAYGSVALAGDRIASLDPRQSDENAAPFRLRWHNVRGEKLLQAREPYTDFGPGGNLKLVFSGNAKLLASCGSIQDDPEKSSPHVRVWESATQREIIRFATRERGTELIAFSQDCRLLAHGATIPLEKPLNPQYVHFEKAIIIRDLSTMHGGVNDKTPRLLIGHLDAITGLAFSPDGKFLATSGSDQVVYIWDVKHFLKRTPVPETKDKIADLWQQLADANPARAYRAVELLERTPKETIALLRKHLKPAVQLDDKVIAQKVRDLSSGNYAVRLQANSALEIAGEQATAHLKQALKNPASLEVKRRLEALLEKVDRPFETPSQLRAYRCLVLLERIGTPEARLLLEELSRGTPSAWLTTEARHSLSRIP